MKNLVDLMMVKAHTSDLLKTIDTLCKKYHCKFILPSEIEKSLDELIGFENEKQVLEDAVLFFRELEEIEFSTVSPNSRFLMFGAPGSGKTDLVSALAKTAQVPLFNVPCELFKQLKKQAQIEKVINMIFKVTNLYEALVLNFDDFGYVISHPEATQIAMLISERIKASDNIVAFLSNTVTGEQEEIGIPHSMIGDNLFNLKKSIVIMPPTVETRKKLLLNYFEDFEIILECKSCDDVDSFASRLAKQTFAMYPKDLEYLVKETILYARRQGKTEVTFRDFNETLLTISAGSLYNTMTPEERISTAYHEIGHVLAGYYSNPKYVLGRVEITPRAMSLGLTQEEVAEENHSLFSKQLKSNIIYSLGGMAAEEIIYHDTTTGVSADLETANATASTMVCDLGMNKNLGPIVDGTGVSSEYFTTAFDKEVQELLKEMYNTTLIIIKEHLNVLEALKNALLEKEVLMGEEMSKIILEVEPNAEVFRQKYL